MPITPVALPTNRSNATAQDTAHTSDHNTLHAFANQTSTSLGTGPEGGFSDLTTRLATNGTIDAQARVAVRKNSTGTVLSRRRLNLIEGSNVTITLADDSPNEESDITIAAAVGTHATTHAAGQSDPLTGALDANARLGVRLNSTGSTYLRRRLNLIAGQGISLAYADDSGNEEVDVTVTGSSVLAAVTSGVVVSATTTETALVGYAIPAGTAVAGTTFRVTVGGNMDQGGTAATWTLRLRLGGVAGNIVASHAFTLPAAVSSQRAWRYQADMVYRSGTEVYSSAAAQLNTSTGMLFNLNVPATTGALASGTQTLNLTVQHSTTSEVTRMSVGTIERL